METELTTAAVQTNLNVVWTLIAGILVFTMQAGFALVETGFTRAKNAANIMMKNLMDFAAGSLGFYILGAALMFGATKAAGWFGWGGLGMPSLATGEGVWDWTFLFFQTMFAAFFARVKPVSTSAKPACIMKTRMAATSVQTTFRLICTVSGVMNG